MIAALLSNVGVGSHRVLAIGDVEGFGRSYINQFLSESASYSIEEAFSTQGCSMIVSRRKSRSPTVGRSYHADPPMTHWCTQPGNAF